jgi:hypothetical protein
MEAVRTSEKSVFNVITSSYIPQYSKLHTRCRENLKSLIQTSVFNSERTAHKLLASSSYRSRGSSLSIVSGYGPDDWTIEVRSPAQARYFPLTSVSRPALGPTQPPVQWLPGVLSPGLMRGRDVTLTTHPHLLPRSWMSRSYTSSLPCACKGVLWDCFCFIFPLHARPPADTGRLNAV